MMSISKREKEVLSLIGLEYSAKEIAQKLCISYHTTISHKKNIMYKLNVKNSAEMVRMGYERGILSIGQATL